ncbi:hypothetical protein BAMA_11865 [Bacillus manliponensis]|uniref:DNA alkylation repair protein n=1 Tax=Bacillus manliponensis TaxID=574376 RepID=A0A073K5U6_9BACI|nr:hypothetical protein [Bacillus manliponensis]KEK17658.1 hypothetical protein BAMA_11865 [Bacillus manliponensis]
MGVKEVYNEEFISLLARGVRQAYPQFYEADFVRRVFEGNWAEKALKERMRHVTTCLHDFLPSNYEEAITILKNVAPQLEEHELAGIILPDFVEMYGLHNWDVSIDALEWFTQYTTSEYAVRPFFIEDQDKMVEQMTKWSLHPHHRVRRLASEGIRSRLPWGMALQQFKKDPLPIIPILTNLKEDESLYVRKSVANNMNDISKDNPEIVLKLAQEWIGKHSHTDWIIKHGCRTLLKKGNQQALSIFGFQDSHLVQVIDFAVSKERVSIGEDLPFSFELKGETEEPVKIRIEYAIDFVKARGNRNRRVFKVTENEITNGKPLSYKKVHSFKDLSTRKHYKGVHTITLILNGKEIVKEDFYVE